MISKFLNTITLIYYYVGTNVFSCIITNSFSSKSTKQLLYLIQFYYRLKQIQFTLLQCINIIQYEKIVLHNLQNAAVDSIVYLLYIVLVEMKNINFAHLCVQNCKYLPVCIGIYNIMVRLCHKFVSNDVPFVQIR